MLSAVFPNLVSTVCSLLNGHEKKMWTFDFSPPYLVQTAKIARHISFEHWWKKNYESPDKNIQILGGKFNFLALSIIPPNFTYCLVNEEVKIHFPPFYHHHLTHFPISLLISVFRTPIWTIKLGYLLLIWIN